MSFDDNIIELLRGTKLLARVSYKEYKRLNYEGYIKEISDEEVEEIKLRMGSIISNLRHKNADKYTGLYITTLLDDEIICRYDIFQGIFSWILKTKVHYHCLSLSHNCDFGLFIRDIKFDRKSADQTKLMRVKLPFGSINDPNLGKDLIEDLEYEIRYSSHKWKKWENGSDNNNNSGWNLSNDKLDDNEWSVDIKESFKNLKSKNISSKKYFDDVKLDKKLDNEVSKFLEEGDEDDLNLKSSNKLLVNINNGNIIDRESNLIENQMVNNGKLDFKQGFVNLFKDNYRGRNLLDWLDNGTRMLCVQKALKEVKLENNRTVFDYIVDLLIKNKLLDEFMEEGISSSVDEDGDDEKEECDMDID